MSGIYKKRSIYYRKYILQITQPSQYRYTQLHYGFAVISEAPRTCTFIQILRPSFLSLRTFLHILNILQQNLGGGFTVYVAYTQ